MSDYFLEQWNEVMESLSFVGFPTEDVTAMIESLAGILHTGDITFEENANVSSKYHTAAASDDWVDRSESTSLAKTTSSRVSHACFRLSKDAVLCAQNPWGSSTTKSSNSVC